MQCKHSYLSFRSPEENDDHTALPQQLTQDEYICSDLDIAPAEASRSSTLNCFTVQTNAFVSCEKCSLKYYHNSLNLDICL